MYMHLIYMYTCTHMQSCTYAPMHAHMCAQKHMYIHVHAQKHTHTYICTHTYTHVQTHTCTHIQCVSKHMHIPGHMHSTVVTEKICLERPNPMKVLCSHIKEGRLQNNIIKNKPLKSIDLRIEKVSPGAMNSSTCRHKSVRVVYRRAL